MINYIISHRQKIIFVIVFVLIFINPNIHGQTNIEKSGTIIQIALPVTAFSTTLVQNDESKSFINFTKSMATSIVLTHSLKRIIDKERPNG